MSNSNFTDREALSHLRELHLADSRIKHPELPYHSAPTFSATKTNDIAKCIKHFLKLKGHHCERTGNEGRVIDQRETFTDTVGISRTIGSFKRIRSSGTKGTSDLKASINGKFVAIELKNIKTKDRISPAQIAYRSQVEASGGIYVIAESLAGFMNWYYSFEK